jgi:hypothetical protein
MLPMQHELKTLPEYWHRVNTLQKRFEIRRNDRDYREGDRLILREWTEAGGYTGNYLRANVVYITAFQQQPGFVVMGIELER